MNAQKNIGRRPAPQPDGRLTKGRTSYRRNPRPPNEFSHIQRASESKSWGPPNYVAAIGFIIGFILGFVSGGVGGSVMFGTIFGLVAKPTAKFVKPYMHHILRFIGYGFTFVLVSGGVALVIMFWSRIGEWLLLLCGIALAGVLIRQAFRLLRPYRATIRSFLKLLFMLFLLVAALWFGFNFWGVGKWW